MYNVLIDSKKGKRFLQVSLVQVKISFICKKYLKIQSRENPAPRLFSDGVANDFYNKKQFIYFF